MRGELVKAMRRQARGEALAAVEATAPAIKGIYDNERLTRKRVDDLALEMGNVRGAVARLEAFRYRTFLRRLRWLLLGR